MISKILNPYRQYSRYAILNSVDLVKTKLPAVSPLFRKTTKMCSFDVVDMFNSLPTDFVLEAVEYYVNKDPVKSSIPLPALLALVNFTLRNGYCGFKGAYYKQKRGLVMGGSASPLLSELAMAYFEEKFVNDSNVLLWTRYVDDVLVFWNGTWRQLELFLNKLKGFNRGIKFTMERETEVELCYLDVTLLREDHCVQSKVYRKFTYSGRYLSYHSSHAKSTKRGIAINLFLRALQLCSTNEYLQAEYSHIVGVLELNSYPKKVINSSKHAAIARFSRPVVKSVDKWFSLDYLPGLFETIRHEMVRHQVNVTCRPRVTLGQIYFDRKSKVRSRMEVIGCVYGIQCACGEWYIGETKRQLKIRICEHRRFVNPRYANEPDLVYKSAVAAHSMTSGHQIKWDEVRVLYEETNDVIRKMKEAFLIKLFHPQLNISPGVSVPAQWYFLLLPTAPSLL